MKFLFLLLFVTSCSSFNFKSWKTEKIEDVKLTDYSEYQDIDYVDHLTSFEQVYRNENSKKLIKTKASTKKYLSSIIKKIENNNELFFISESKPDFYIIDSKIPFHFSLPNRKFFFSSSLLKKYIKNEAMLYCLMIYEFIRSEKNIYRKTIIIPTGTLDTNRMLSLLRLRTADKIEIHKWAYYLLKRSGVDTDTYLSWLQIKNRNSLDFSIQLGDIQSISREEALFKSFLIESVKESNSTNRHRGSSRQFYSLLNDIKR